MFDLILNRLRGKRILVLGFGREGRSTWRFLQKYLPEATVAVADKNEMELVQYFGTSYLEAIYDYDIVIKIPSTSTPRIQECQTLIGHIICSIVEERIFGEKYNKKE